MSTRDPVPVEADDLVYAKEDVGSTDLWCIVVRYEAHARGSRYELWVVFDFTDNRAVITLANFGKVMTLDHYPERLHWDYVADKLSLRPTDAQVVTHMINRAMKEAGR